MKAITLSISFLLFFSIISSANPGDTVYVKTFTFDSIHTRRATFDFPEAQSWEKVMMMYTLKCDDATPWDGYDCGEWDYTTFTNVYEHTGHLDSAVFNHSKYTLNNLDFDVFDGSIIPKYHKFEKEYDEVTYTYSSSNEVQVGTNEAYSPIGISNGDTDSKTFLLYKESNLTAASVTAGEILNIKFATNSSDVLEFPINIKVAQSDLTDLSLAEVSSLSFTSVYDGIFSYDGLGVVDIEFNTPLDWDGTSNIIFEISIANNTNIIELESENMTYNSILCSNEKDYYLDFENFSYVEAPASAFSSISEEVTVCCWTYGDPDIQPQNDYLFEAYGQDGERQMNVHFPWSNGNIYWDCGNDGGGYDRIYTAAAEHEYEGKWNHMAFVKNTTTGSMKIYINGSLWHSETGKTKNIENISSFYIGGSANPSIDRAYDGYIDDFSVWNKELSEEQIQELMFSKLDASHEDYTNLLVYYDFDENPGSGNLIEDKSANNADAHFMGELNRMSYRGTDRFKLFNESVLLPTMTFTQGEYTIETNTITYVDSVLMNQQVIMEYENLDFYTIHSIDTLLYYNNYELFTNATDITDTTYFTADYSVSNSELTYYGEAYEVINTIQLQNYVTPYGIGLSLGNNGFTWAYDVTDYGEYLHDIVDISSHNTQELLDLTFVFIEGTPPRNILSFDQVYLGDFGHANIANDVQMQPKKLKRNPDADFFKVKTRTTGHGMAGSGNCAEFCPTYHNISVEGEERYEWYNWTECADNPVQPQGGTWIFDRAGWCPGSFADTYDWDITEFVTDTDSIEVDYGMTQYPSGSGEGNYRVSVQLIQYDEINFDNDAAIEDIITPTDASIYGKFNPVCNNPKIMIKNTGANTLNSALIEYGINGDYSYTHQWTGELEFLENEEVALPIIDWREFTEDNSFNVRISLPNNLDDEYTANNSYKSNFEKVDIFTDTVMFIFKTNNYGSESYYQILDQEGNVLLDRDGLTSNTIYNDTLAFPPGCYEIRIYDRGEDGLDFWYYQGADGQGYARLRYPGAQYAKHFKADFGSFIHYQFVYADLSYILEEEANRIYFDVYPNPNDGNFKLNLNFDPESQSEISVMDIYGRLVRTFKMSELESNSFNIDLSDLNKGIYFINIQSGRVNQTQKLVIK